MTTKILKTPGRGPFRPEQLRSGDPYELSNGHPIECLPAGGRGSRANLVGGLALATDPEVEAAGFDTGYSADAYTLRAPDLAVGNVPDAPGWVKGAPPLAVEYADTGQDEADLRVKIRELFAAGTRLIWVVRLTGARRVEVHRPAALPEVRRPGEVLEAPGILRNPVAVEALFDPRAAQEAALRNLLQRRGYAGLEAVRAQGEAEGQARGKAEGKTEGRAEGRVEGKAEGRVEGKAEGELKGLRAAILQVLDSRGLTIDEGIRAGVHACTDAGLLSVWLRRAAVCADTRTLLDPP